jgi:hypothetical protein
MTKEAKKTAALTVEEFDVSYLLAHKAKYNPRTISNRNRAGLKLSLRKFGYTQNIVFNRRTETLVSGHQRLDILAEQGYERVQVHVVDLPEKLEKELNVAMNSPSVAGEFTPDIDRLIQEILDDDPEFYDLLTLSSLQSEDGDQDLTEEVRETKKDVVYKELELLPYEHYDAILIVCSALNDFLYLSSLLGLDQRKIISPPCTGNRKIGKVRAIPADRLIAILKGGVNRNDEPEIDVDFTLDGEPVLDDEEETEADNADE